MHMFLISVNRISIHASAKEATPSKGRLERLFQFQSTPPRRRRRNRGTEGSRSDDFNPRLREGGDRNIL